MGKTELKVRCARCGEVHVFSIAAAGKQFECDSCGQPNRIPAPAPASNPNPTPKSPSPAKKPANASPNGHGSSWDFEILEDAPAAGGYANFELLEDDDTSTPTNANVSRNRQPAPAPKPASRPKPAQAPAPAPRGEIRAKCVHCGHLHTFSMAAAGKSFNCDACEGRNIIPEIVLSEPPTPTRVHAPTPTRVHAPAPEEHDVAPGFLDDLYESANEDNMWDEADDDEAPRPVRTNYRGRGTWKGRRQSIDWAPLLKIGGLAAGALFLIIALIMVVRNFDEWGMNPFVSPSQKELKYAVNLVRNELESATEERALTQSVRSDVTSKYRQAIKVMLKGVDKMIAFLDSKKPDVNNPASVFGLQSELQTILRDTQQEFREIPEPRTLNDAEKVWVTDNLVGEMETAQQKMRDALMRFASGLPGVSRFSNSSMPLGGPIPGLDVGCGLFFLDVTDQTHADAITAKVRSTLKNPPYAITMHSAHFSSEHRGILYIRVNNVVRPKDLANAIGFTKIRVASGRRLLLETPKMSALGNDAGNSSFSFSSSSTSNPGPQPAPAP